MGDQVEFLFTKFYYQDAQLCFQIILELEEEQVVFADYNDYNDYKSALKMLSEARKQKEEIIIPSITNRTEHPPSRQASH